MQFVAIGRIFRNLARIVARQQCFDGPQHVEHLKPAILDPHQILLLRDRLFLLPLHLLERRDRRLRLALHPVGPREGTGIEIRRIGRPREEHAGKTDRRRRQQAGQRSHRPRLLRLDQPVDDDLPRQQVGSQARAAGPLQRESVGRAERQPVFAKGWRIHYRRALEPAIGLQPLHVELQLFRDEVGEAAEFRGVAEQQHLADRGRAVGAREVVQ